MDSLSNETVQTRFQVRNLISSSTGNEYGRQSISILSKLEEGGEFLQLLLGHVFPVKLWRLDVQEGVESNKATDVWWHGAHGHAQHWPASRVGSKTDPISVQSPLFRTGSNESDQVINVTRCLLQVRV